MHPEDSVSKSDIFWIVLTVVKCNNQRELFPSMPQWIWMPNDGAIDELQTTDNHKVETFTDYLLEANKEADDLVSQMFGVDNMELDLLPGT